MYFIKIKHEPVFFSKKDKYLNTKVYQLKENITLGEYLSPINIGI